PRLQSCAVLVLLYSLHIIILFPFFLYDYLYLRHLHSFPTRRSSDLLSQQSARRQLRASIRFRPSSRSVNNISYGCTLTMAGTGSDRKSTRLNSSHGSISYAVFCLKKKKKQKKTPHTKQLQKRDATTI